jgi:hypothetical protein
LSDRFGRANALLISSKIGDGKQAAIFLKPPFDKFYAIIFLRR